MKKNFLKCMAVVAVIVALVVGLTSCRMNSTSVDKAEMTEGVKKAVSEMLKMENINKDDTLIKLDSNNVARISGVGTDSVQWDSVNASSRPIQVSIYTDSGSVFDNGKDFVEMVSVIAAFGSIFGAPVLILIFLFYYWYKAKRDRNRVIEAAIMNNVKVDPNLFNDYKTPRTRLHSALVWMAWGMGIIIFFICVDAAEAAGLGAIPLFVGLAKLITYFMEDRKQPTETKREQNADAE